jgi:glucan phosphoethanolaminetransferase (alkaline phosphatase superfamily)
VNRRTVRTGLRLLSVSVMLLMLGTFYAQQLNDFLAVGGAGVAEFIRLAFFWAAVLGFAAIVMISAGLLRRSQSGERLRIMPSLIFLTLLLALFFILFYRSMTLPPAQKPLRPGETLVI